MLPNEIHEENGGSFLQGHNVYPGLDKEVAALGARDMEACMQCGNCASTCPLSKGENTFPRKIYRYLQLGLKEELLSSPEPWLCYYCGDCNTDCPRGAEPAETMMAARRWLTTQYDITGLATKFYTSPKWEVGAFMAIFLFVVGLFLTFHGPVVVERVELNTFAPVHWVHIGDQVMIVIVFALVFANAFNMYRKIMRGTKIPLTMYLTQAPVFVINYFTQKNWRKCGTGPGSAWWRHLMLFSGWVAMEVLVMIFLTSFQTDIVHPFWHPTRFVGYYATVTLLLGSGTMLYSRWYKKKENLHRYSDFTDQFFLLLIFIIAATGIMVHITRLMGLPLTTYAIYVIHVGICVSMLMIMLPFGKLSHLMYRPLAIFLTTLKQKVQKESELNNKVMEEAIGDTFQTCMQCGTCTASCPKPQFIDFSPRQILRNISLDRATNINVDQAAWACNTCDACVATCPRGIPLSDLMVSIREKSVEKTFVPEPVATALKNLKKERNPFSGHQIGRVNRQQALGQTVFDASRDEILLHNCCHSLSAPDWHPNSHGAKALNIILKAVGIQPASLGDKEQCCGDLARVSGEAQVADKCAAEATKNFAEAKASRILTSSPHCFERLKENDNVAHSTEFIATLMKNGVLVANKKQDITVTYHDPCYLGRKNEMYEQPRAILKALPGVKFVEMTRNKKESLCCGGGGSGVFQFPEKGMSNTTLRIAEAITTGASVLVTSCPYCINMFEESIRKQGLEDKIQVRDINTLLVDSLDLSGAGVAPLHQEREDQEEIHV